ncbi:MAG: NHL repeat-containing protein [Myxococcota bacterium]
MRRQVGRVGVIVWGLVAMASSVVVLPSCTSSAPSSSIEVRVSGRAALEGPITSLSLDVRASDGSLIERVELDTEQESVALRLLPGVGFIFELFGRFDDGESEVVSFLGRTVVDLFASRRVQLQAFEAGDLSLTVVGADGETPLPEGTRVHFEPTGALDGYTGSFEGLIGADGSIAISLIAGSYTATVFDVDDGGGERSDVMLATTISVLAATLNVREVSLAASVPPPPATEPALFETGQAADSVLGQGDFDTGRQNATDAGAFSTPSRIIFDSNGRLYVSDRDNNRVMIFESLSDAQNHGTASVILGQPDATSNDAGLGPDRLSGPTGLALDANNNLYVCDSLNDRVLRFGDVESLTTGAAADRVLGKPDFVTGQTFFSARADNFGFPTGLAIVDDPDTGGDALFVADTGNSRVLRFDDLATIGNGDSATQVLGQPDFETTDNAPGPANLDQPEALAVFSTAGGVRSLFVADTLNNRVVFYDDVFARANGADADGVLGQSDLESGESIRLQSCSDLGDGSVDCFGSIVDPAARMFEPAGLRFDGDRLYVSDQGNSRILVFESAFDPAPVPASSVLGQGSFLTADRGVGTSILNGPKGLTIGPAPDASGSRLYAVDQRNHRIVAWTSDADGSVSPDILIGQQGYLGNAQNEPRDNTFAAPVAVDIDPTTGKLFVVDESNSRVLRYRSADALVSGAAAEAVFGQPDLERNFQGFPDGTAPATAATLRSPADLTFDSVGNLYVADRGARRVVRYDGASSLVSGASASAVFGQPDLNSSGFLDATSASSLRSPGAVEVDAQDRLWVADNFDRRILRFDNATVAGNNPPADGVLGQPDFVSNAAEEISATSIGGSFGLAASTDGTLWVSDFANRRILRFDNAAGLSNGAPASGVLGQPDFTTRSFDLPLDQSFAGLRDVEVDAFGALYATTTLENRVLIFVDAANKANGGPVDIVLGQPALDTTTQGTTATSMASPRGLALDTRNNLYVADTTNNRVLRFDGSED